tara:strand:+ start:5502 stop:6854 length:1353 start_codon:yes stop_codon:yes gene_type:complete
MKKIYSNLENFHSFIPNLSYFFSSNVLTQLCSFIVIVLFARNYSAIEFGKFTIAQTVFFLLYSLSFSNIHYYLNKAISQNFQNRRKEIGSCFLITFYASVFLYTLLALNLNLFSIDKELKYLILIIGLILIAEPFSIFYSEIFVRGQFKIIFKIRILQNLIFFVIKMFIIFNKLDFIFLAVSYFLESLFFSMLVIFYFKKNGNNFINLVFNREYTKKIIKKIFLFPLLAFSLVVAMRIDIIMISNILGTEYSAYYSSASRLITIILIFGTLFFQFIYPNLSRFVENKDELDRIIRNIIFLSFYFSLSFFICVLIFGKFYLSLFGDNYVSAHVSFIFLSISLFFSLVINFWIQKQFLLSNHLNILFYQIAAILFNIIFNSYLINSFGIDGAAIASLLSTFLAFVITNFTNPIEIYNIIECFGFKKQKQAAKDILKMIFVNKKPEKKEKTND